MPPGSVKPSMTLSSVMTKREEADMTDSMEKFAGVTPDMKEGFQKLKEIFDKEVFELYIRQEQGYVPYMMNDALECYLVLTDCRCTGKYLPGYESCTVGYLSFKKEEKVLVVHQGEENIFTLWFREIQVKLEGYQYHKIGHFWLEGKGQEQWRQLVYMLGTVYDKYEYFGKIMCTSKEQELMRLMEFRPFRYWSPIKESLDSYYPDTVQGAAEFRKIAGLAGDRAMGRLAGIYEKVPLLFLERVIIRRMEKPCSQKLYQKIRELICKESSQYKKRDYGKEMNEQIEKERLYVEEELHRRGFQGKYPRFFKEGMEILAVEEHPFTVRFMEWEKFDFRIQLMVSEDFSGKKKDLGLNGGFFKGKERQGRIESVDCRESLHE